MEKKLAEHTLYATLVKVPKQTNSKSIGMPGSKPEAERYRCEGGTQAKSHDKKQTMTMGCAMNSY